jgi:hypothetical protein
MMPLLPSAMFPSAPRNASAALRLCRVVECPHCASWSSNQFRLTGSPAFWSALRMYSIVSRVGLARGLAKIGGGAREAAAIG